MWFSGNNRSFWRSGMVRRWVASRRVMALWYWISCCGTTVWLCWMAFPKICGAAVSVELFCFVGFVWCCEAYQKKWCCCGVGWIVSVLHELLHLALDEHQWNLWCRMNCYSVVVLDGHPWSPWCRLSHRGREQSCECVSGSDRIRWWLCLGGDLLNSSFNLHFFFIFSICLFLFCRKYSRRRRAGESVVSLNPFRLLSVSLSLFLVVSSL